MLIQFSVENYLSIKEKIVFSMVAGNNDENIENTIELIKWKEKILKSTAIYGANAAGKTNFMRAFESSIIAIRNSNNMQINSKLLGMTPFKFDKITEKKPCKFEFIIFTNNIRYVYGFSADVNKVYEEYLYKYLSAKPTMIF
jgi:AAA15 family ATPase/GTPase